MCYYNNRYINSNICSRINTGFSFFPQQPIVGPTGPRGPMGTVVQNTASIVGNSQSQTLAPNSSFGLSPNFVLGDSIILMNNSTYINLEKGIYYISYSFTASNIVVPSNISFGFTLNNDVIENSVVTLQNTNVQQSIQKSFLLNVEDNFINIQLTNISNQTTNANNLSISIIKVG